MITNLSHSSLETYVQCGEKFRLKKIERLPDRPGWSLVGGSAAHAATEELDLMDMGVVTTARSFQELFELEISDRLERQPEFGEDEWHRGGRKSAAWPDKEDRKWWQHHGPQMVQAWATWKRAQPWDVWVTAAGEPAIEIELTGTLGDFPWKGYVDRVLEDPRTGELMVVDLKFGSREPKSNMQLGSYAYAIHALQGVFPRWGSYWMGRKGMNTTPADLTEYCDGRLDFDYGEVRRGIEAGIFLPNRSDLCSSCGVKEYCRAYGGSQAKSVLPYTAKEVLV